ncbi:MAG TPA: hypothetical protein VGE21_01700 [Flavobacteriales bacterium]
MKWLPLMAALGLAGGLRAQQGWLPLSRTIDANGGAWMHGFGNSGHSAVRPYLREDIPGSDTLITGTRPFLLQRATDPSRTLRGGPLLDLLAGPSVGDSSMLKYRAGAGGWLEWSPGARWTFHADGMGWSEALPNYLDSTARATQVTAGEGYADRTDATVTHLDWNAWADYRAGEYFHLTLGRGKNFFGEGIRSLFLSDEATSYPYFRITTTAWRIKYVNLFAMMNDIRGAGGDPTRYRTKFTSMHYLSWNATKRLNIGVFESIIWQDNDPKYPRGFDISYVNPVIFYRPVEFGLGSPDNALLGFAVNVKVGRKGLVYSQLMFDEFLLGNVRSGEGWYGNKQGLQLGVVMHDAFKVDGLTLRGEWNYVRPFMYTHSDTRQNYSHYGQPLAHPYGSGFWEAIAHGEWRKDRWLLTHTASFAVMGADTALTGYGSYGNNIFRSDRDRIRRDGVRGQDYGYYIGRPSEVLVVQNELRVARVIEPRAGILLEFAYTFRSEAPEQGDAFLTNYFRAGISTNLRDRHAFQTRRYVLE